MNDIWRRYSPVLAILMMLMMMGGSWAAVDGADTGIQKIQKASFSTQVPEKISITSPSSTNKPVSEISNAVKVGYLAEEKGELSEGGTAMHLISFDVPASLTLYAPKGCVFTLSAREKKESAIVVKERIPLVSGVTTRSPSPPQVEVKPGLWEFTISAESGSGEYYLVAKRADKDDTADPQKELIGEELLIIPELIPQQTVQPEPDRTVIQSIIIPPTFMVPPESDADSDIHCIGDEIFSRTNTAYAGGDYIRDSLLDEIAEAYSQALCSLDENRMSPDTFSHVMDGAGPGDRLTNAGYRWRSYAENIFHNGCSGGSCTSVSTQAMDRWLNSQGHRRNIMNENAAWNSHIGVGVSSCEEGCYYITLLFASPW